MKIDKPTFILIGLLILAYISSPYCYGYGAQSVPLTNNSSAGFFGKSWIPTTCVNVISQHDDPPKSDYTTTTTTSGNQVRTASLPSTSTTTTTTL